jgi:hypothetical protein
MLALARSGRSARGPSSAAPNNSRRTLAFRLLHEAACLVEQGGSILEKNLSALRSKAARKFPRDLPPTGIALRYRAPSRAAERAIERAPERATV